MTENSSVHYSVTTSKTTDVHLFSTNLNKRTLTINHIKHSHFYKKNYKTFQRKCMYHFLTNKIASECKITENIETIFQTKKVHQFCVSIFC